MKNILGILKTAFTTVALVLITALSIGNAYILFAPDEWPKPFYLSYRYPIVPGSEGETSTEGTGHTAAAPTTGGASAAAPAEGGKTTGESGGEKTPGSVASLEIRPGQGIMIDTGTKIVNLVDPTGRKYLRSTLVLEFSPTDLTYYTMEGEEKTAYLETFKEDVNTRLPVINDIIIQMLASQTYDSVYTADGKEALRKKLMDTINAQLPEYRVIYVYFTEFVVQ